MVDAADVAELSNRTWRLVTSNSKNICSYAGTAGILMHRAIVSVEPGYQIDHINRDMLDNRRANLRVCTAVENQRNRRKPSHASSSRFKGVYRIAPDGKWRARIKLDGKHVSLGLFLSEDDAARAYDAAALAHYGDFALTNHQLGLLSEGAV